MIVSKFSLNSVVVADCYLVTVPLELVIVIVDKDGIVSFILSRSVWFNSLNLSVHWGCVEYFFLADCYAPCLGAWGRTTSCLD